VPAAGQGNRSLNVPVVWKLLVNELARSKKGTTRIGVSNMNFQKSSP
jgi:hypothetical protein